MDESARLAVRRQAVRTALQSVRVRLASTDAFLLRARRGEVAASADELASRLGEGRHALRQATELTGDTPQQTGRLLEANHLLDARQAIIAHVAGAPRTARDS